MVGLKITGLDNVKRALLDIELQVSARGRLPVLMNRIGRVLRDDAKRRITSQDGGSWEELGKWQRAKTGRRKALLKEREHIHHKVLPAGAAVIVYYNMRGSWKLTTHGTGFVVSPHGKFITVKLVDGRPLMLPQTQTAITFRWKRPSVVPARRVFAHKERAERYIRPIIAAWLAEIKARIK